MIKLPNGKPVPTQYKGVEFTFVLITPEWAAATINELDQRLAKGEFRQRSPRWRAILRYAQDMRGGNWQVTHQGIAFDERGDMIDGQNRVRAVMESGVAVWMVVSMGWPVVQKTTVGAKTIDALDQGVGRNVAHALQISHGYDVGSVEMASVARNISKFVLTNPNRRADRDAQMSAAESLFILERLNYCAAVERLISIVTTKRNRPAGMTAVWSWYWMIHPKKAESFATDYETMANLPVGHPAMLLYRYNTTRSKRAHRREPDYMEIVSHTLKCYHEQADVKIMRPNPDAHFWLLKLNWEHAKKITALMVNEKVADEPQEGVAA